MFIGKQSKMKIYIRYKARRNIWYWNLDSDGEGYELFNDFRRKNPEKDFWPNSRKIWMEDQD